MTQLAAAWARGSTLTWNRPAARNLDPRPGNEKPCAVLPCSLEFFGSRFSVHYNYINPTLYIEAAKIKRPKLKPDSVLARSSTFCILEFFIFKSSTFCILSFFIKINQKVITFGHQFFASRVKKRPNHFAGKNLFEALNSRYVIKHVLLL